MKTKTLRNFTTKGRGYFVLLMMAILLAPARMWGQDPVTIGEGTTTNQYLPTFEWYCYSLTQQLYTPTELTMAGTINSITFYTAASASRTWDIYMVHTSKTAFSSTSDWITPTTADKVFSGNVSYTSGNWTTITLDTPFEYNGTDNLCLIVDDNTGSYVSDVNKYVFTPTSGGNCSIRIYSDGTNYVATSPTSYNGTLMTVKNQLRIDITPLGSPKALTASNITGHEATLSWTAPDENVQSYQYQYKEGELDWTSLESTANTLVTLTGLIADTDYTFRVKALYADWESSFVSTTFHTILTCPRPTALQATLTQTDATIATLSWTENGTTTDWVLEYGTNNDFSNATVVEVNGTPSIDLTGLTPETLYYARVKADCGEDQSLWSNVITFKPTTSITIPIAQGTVHSSYSYPVNMLYNYSLTEQIYEFDKIGYQGTINSVAFCYHPANSASFSISGVKLFMKHVTRTVFANNLDMEPLTSDDLVWTGTFEAFVDGWVTITLDTPFEYDGESNLLIATLDETIGYPGGNNYFEYSTCDDYKLIQWYGDNTSPDPYNTVLGWSDNKRYEQNRSNIQLNIFPSETPRPVRLAVSNLYGHIGTISWETLNENAIGYQYQYKTDDRGDWTPLVTTTDLSVSLEGLEPETNYLFRVKALYADDGESEFSTTSFTTTVACISPIDLHATLTLGDGTVATLSWTEAGLANEWVLEYGTNADFTGATSVIVNDTPSKSLTGLLAETNYYARVKAVCGGDDGESLWSDVVEYTPTFAIPLTVFDGTSTDERIPMYGEQFVLQTKSECIMPYDLLTDMDDCQIKSLTFYPSSVNSGDWGTAYQQVFLKEVDLPILENYYSGITDATIVYEGNLPTPTLSDEGYTITFSQPYTYQGGYLLIGVYNIGSGHNNSVYWYGVRSASLEKVAGYGASASFNQMSQFISDNFLPKTTFDYIPNPTARPRNLTATNIAIHSATLSWTAANENVTGYLYQYKPEGGEWPTEWTSTSALSVDLEGLTAETEYTFRVKALYGEVESNEASITFVPTPTMTLTFYEGVTNATSGIPIYGSYYNYYAKNECLFPATQLAGMDGATISSITFYAKKIYDGLLNGITQVFVKEVDHATLSSYEGTEGATIVFEGELPLPTTSLDGYTITFSQDYTYHGGNLLIGIYNITPGSSSKQVDWYGDYTSQNTSANGYSSSSLEEVGCTKSSWLPKTTFCFVFRNPWNLQASDVTVDGATVSWNASRVDVLGYEYQYRTEDGEWTELATTDNTTVTLSDLTSVTYYTFQVRSVFEEGVYGDFVSVSFLTPQIPVLVDFSHSFADNFEEDNNWVLLNGSETNQWVIGTATHLQGQKSLYISNDGQSYAYNSTMSHVFATKTFHLAPGSYEVGYTWKTKGCNNDKVNMVVVPESATFAAGESAIDYIQSDECLAFDSYYSSSNYPSWYVKTKQFEVVEEGLYKVVFYWYNLNATAYTPPAAIDNFYLNMYLGAAPNDLMTSNITAHTAQLNWVENGTAEAWQVKYYTYDEFVDSQYNPDNENFGHFVEAETNVDFSLSGLAPETEYVWFVRSSYTMDGQTGYTRWSSRGDFQTAVSCLPVTNLHPTEVGANTATLTWSTDTHQEAGNAPTSWNVRYAKAPAVTYDFETEEGIPDYSTDEETDWTVEEDAENAHSDTHCLESHNSNYNTYLYIPAYGGAAASFWVKSLVENESVYISVYYETDYNGGDYKAREKDRGEYLGNYEVTPGAYKKITLDLADYQGNGNLELNVSGMVAIDDITVNIPETTVTPQTLDFNQGGIGDYAIEWNNCTLAFEGENGYIMTEEEVENAGALFSMQLGGQVSFLAKALDVTEAVEYTVFAYQYNALTGQMEIIDQKTISVTDIFANYNWDLTAYSGEAYLLFIANMQPSLVIDDLSIPMVSMYNTLTVEGEPTLQLTDLQQLAVHIVEVQAHCGDDDDSNWASTSFVPALCESEDQCKISYEWNTVDGDGPWSDAYLKVVHHESGIRVATCRMENGNSGMGYFSLCNGEVYDLYCYYDGKGYVDFTVYDAAGEVIASYAQFQSLPENGPEYITFTMNCDVCQRPTDLMVTGLTTQSATLTWEQGGDVTSWLVSYRDANVTSYEATINQSNWTAMPQGWLPLAFDNDGYLETTEDWTPVNGALVSEAASFLFIPVNMGGHAVITARGNEDEALLIGVYQDGSPVGVYSNYIPYPPEYSLTETAQSYTVDLSDYEGNGYLFLYHDSGDEPANLYLDQIVVYEYVDSGWSEGVIVNTTPSYTFTGLTAGTAYQAKVQADCGDNEYSNPAKVLFTTPFCNPENQCEISYVLRDSYGDSWENAYVSVVHQNSNTEVARLTMQSNDGYELMGTLALCDGETYDFMYVMGNCCVSEHRFAIYDPSGEVVMDYLNVTPNATDVISYTMDCSSEPTTILFVEGWNWWAPTSEVSLEALATAIGNYVRDIMTEDGEPVSAFVPGEMYRFLVNVDCEFTLNGTPASSVEIEIEEGANWFGFIGSETTVTAAFANFEPVAGDKVISQNEGFAIYNGEAWVGTLTTLVPGKGYVYVSQDTESKTLNLGQ